MATSARWGASAVLAWPPLGATAFVSAVMVGTAAARLASPTPELTDATLLVYEAALCALAVALLVGLLVEPWARTKVADLVVDLRQAGSGTLRDALAQALGDPTLEIGYRLDRGYVDSEGRPLALPAEGSDRKVTRVDQDGKPIAVLVHDAAVLDDPGLSDALGRAARLAAANARLQAEVRTQLDRAGRIAPAPGARRRRGATPARATPARDGRRATDGAGGQARGRRAGGRGCRAPERGPAAARSRARRAARSRHRAPPGRHRGGRARRRARIAGRAQPGTGRSARHGGQRARGARESDLLRLLGGARERHQVRQRLERRDLGRGAGGTAARRDRRRRRRRRGARRRQWTLRARRSRRGARRDVPARQPLGGGTRLSVELPLRVQIP